MSPVRCAAASKGYDRAPIRRETARAAPASNVRGHSVATKRIVVLGGGFGGVYAARHLEKMFPGAPAVEIPLVSRDNFFLYTPMLHEVAASDLDITHIVSPLRTLLKRTQIFI